MTIFQYWKDGSKTTTGMVWWLGTEDEAIDNFISMVRAHRHNVVKLEFWKSTKHLRTVTL